ncbi:hypothetical protein ACRRTK_024432 [Alexandromys fortis]
MLGSSESWLLCLWCELGVECPAVAQLRPEARKKKAYLLVMQLSRMGTDMRIGLSVTSDLPRNLQSRPHPKLLTTLVLA